eukprot:m.77287 g.77287  ORF g.77287 m.77287 type:complete len:778 (+) comp14460_c0_seq2:940-3273(+)
MDLRCAASPSLGRTAAALTTLKADVINQGVETVSAYISVTIEDQNGKAVASEKSGSSSISVNQAVRLQVQASIDAAELWCIARPYLYTVTTSVMVNDQATDTVTTSIGVHSTNWTSNQGLFMNGQHVKSRGFCNHNDFEGLGMAVPDRVNLFRAQGLRGLGGNSWRMSHNPPIPELLDILDRVGIVVMDENRLFDNISAEVANMGDLVRRDRNHPSVIIWSFCNEVGCEGSHETAGPAFKAITYAMDGSRPTLGNMFSYDDSLSKLIDVQGFSHRDESIFKSFHTSDPNKAVFASECCSCTSMRDEDFENNTAFALSNFNGPCVSSQTNWTESLEFVVGQMVWTGFDYYGEPAFSGWPHKSSSFGAYDLSGFSKAAAHWYRAWWLANVSTSNDDRPPVGHEHEVYIVEGNTNSSRLHQAQVTPCQSSTSAPQNFTFVSINSTHGYLRQNAAGLCIPNFCTQPGDACYPLQLRSCSVVDTVAFQYQKQAFIAPNNSCLDIHGGDTTVGLYTCNQQSNQQWSIRDSHIVSNASGTPCLTDVGEGLTFNLYSNAPAVEVYVDNNKVATVDMPFYQYAALSVGGGFNITALIRDTSGKVVASHTRLQQGHATGLRLSLDAPHVDTGTGAAVVLDGQDVALVRVEIVDDNGQVVRDASHRVQFDITSGPGRVLAVGNGDPRCHEPNMVSYRSAYHGLVRGIIQVTENAMGDEAERSNQLYIDIDSNIRTKVVTGGGVTPEAIVIQAFAPGLAAATLTIPTSIKPQDTVLAAAANASRAAYLR